MRSFSWSGESFGQVSQVSWVSQVSQCKAIMSEIIMWIMSGELSQQLKSHLKTKKIKTKLRSVCEDTLFN